jgi:hypothetical protein
MTFTAVFYSYDGRFVVLKHKCFLFVITIEERLKSDFSRPAGFHAYTKLTQYHNKVMPLPASSKFTDTPVTILSTVRVAS